MRLLYVCNCLVHSYDIKSVTGYGRLRKSDDWPDIRETKEVERDFPPTVSDALNIDECHLLGMLLKTWTAEIDDLEDARTPGPDLAQGANATQSGLAMRRPVVTARHSYS